MRNELIKKAFFLATLFLFCLSCNETSYYKTNSSVEEALFVMSEIENYEEIVFFSQLRVRVRAHVSTRPVLFVPTFADSIKKPFTYLAVTTDSLSNLYLSLISGDRKSKILHDQKIDLNYSFKYSEYAKSYALQQMLTSDLVSNEIEDTSLEEVLFAIKNHSSNRLPLFLAQVIAEYNPTLRRQNISFKSLLIAEKKIDNVGHISLIRKTDGSLALVVADDFRPPSLKEFPITSETPFDYNKYRDIHIN